MFSRRPQKKRPRKAPVVVEDDNKSYDVEEILNHRDMKHGTEYFIKWKGYAKKHNSWEGLPSLCNCADFLSEYWAKQLTKSEPLAQMFFFTYRFDLIPLWKFLVLLVLEGRTEFDDVQENYEAIDWSAVTVQLMSQAQPFIDKVNSRPSFEFTRDEMIDLMVSTLSSVPLPQKRRIQEEEDEVEGEFPCEFVGCGKILTTKLKWQNHGRHHTLKKCEFPGCVETVTAKGLPVHVQKVHKRQLCPHCGLDFGANQIYNKHVPFCLSLEDPQRQINRKKTERKRLSHLQNIGKKEIVGRKKAVAKKVKARARKTLVSSSPKTTEGVPPKDSSPVTTNSALPGIYRLLCHV